MFHDLTLPSLRTMLCPRMLPTARSLTLSADLRNGYSQWIERLLLADQVLRVRISTSSSHVSITVSFHHTLPILILASLPTPANGSDSRYTVDRHPRTSKLCRSPTRRPYLLLPFLSILRSFAAEVTRSPDPREDPNADVQGLTTSGRSVLEWCGSGRYLRR